jgi:hypothetical protein
MFGDVRPAATMLAVAALVDSRMLVEVEVVAYRDEPGDSGAGGAVTAEATAGEPP